MDKFEDQEVVESVKMLDANVEVLSKMINNILQWSEAQTESYDYNPESINLMSLIDDNIEMFKMKAKKKSITINNNVQNDIVVYGAPNMISICVNNLISNAIKFTNRDGKIDINAREAGFYYEIEVSDSGIGINAEDIPYLFRPEVHYSSKGTENEKGAGLGLTICRQFIKLNGGRIWAESEPGKGSKFKFTVSKADEKILNNQ